MSKKETATTTEPPVELEWQFILRLPEEPAMALREILRSGSNNLKDRFSIRLENDVRYGEVRIDNWFLHAKVVDLPTIVESLKTIDNKSFYKTADICQMMICKEEDDQTTDDESPAKHKKKDPNKVDKKFLWPHGITPPLKNVRRRRFRKTLKKKYVEAPEVEKEVKRLLRGDNDAVSVKWEVISEEDEKKTSMATAPQGDNMGNIVIKEEPNTIADTNTQTSVDVAEHDIFGEAVSDSDEEEARIDIIEEMEENSRLSADDSRISDSMSMNNSGRQTPGVGDNSASGSGLVTEFSKSMFTKDNNRTSDDDLDEDDEFEFGRSGYKPAHTLSIDEIRARVDQLQKDLADLKERRNQQEMEVANIENHALRQRFQDLLDNLLQQQLEKEQEYQYLTDLLNPLH
ncbi:transcription initiation factor TFIID subunit 7 [Cimex lectularius]|uniref:TAFII55 protein conserved region domain-containing protein n=1 Tax=Cimex lectularius TaxID=79782 RepID=A0A8I6RYB2_CIMLE|nr:transcription initiation factor TFIID subunit 7 [Cimex lectularius]